MRHSMKLLARWVLRALSYTLPSEDRRRIRSRRRTNRPRCHGRTGRAGQERKSARGGQTRRRRRADLGDRATS